MKFVVAVVLVLGLVGLIVACGFVGYWFVFADLF